MFLAILSAIPAAADSFSTFYASGTFSDGSTLGGNFVVDETTGVISSADFILSGSSNYTFTNIVNQSHNQVPGDYNVGIFNSTSTEEFNFDLPDPSESPLIGYTGGPFCSQMNPCVNGRESYLYNASTGMNGATLVSGSLPSTATPEPSGFALLGTGILGVYGFARRRFTR